MNCFFCVLFSLRTYCFEVPGPGGVLDKEPRIMDRLEWCHIGPRPVVGTVQTTSIHNQPTRNMYQSSVESWHDYDHVENSVDATLYHGWGIIEFQQTVFVSASWFCLVWYGEAVRGCTTPLYRPGRTSLDSISGLGWHGKAIPWRWNPSRKPFTVSTKTCGKGGLLRSSKYWSEAESASLTFKFKLSGLLKTRCFPVRSASISISHKHDSQTFY